MEDFPFFKSRASTAPEQGENEVGEIGDRGQVPALTDGHEHDFLHVLSLMENNGLTMTTAAAETAARPG
ncbi:hypothetical protein, partial [Chromobacterium sp. IRSSSOUMB001]|uniref:hypothetical protein n=1 Tax=Chromobacterium sp. IRSSSOUMB001 TaxID=2927123 RepID=UPI0020BF088E